MEPRNLLASLAQDLRSCSDTPALDARVLLAHVLGKSTAWALAHPDVVLLPEQQQFLEQATHRLAAGEPLPYVLGRWEFFGLSFAVSPAVLIPRPETELLVGVALDWLRKRSHPKPWAADVGCGSGCIAISLAVHIPFLKVVAMDISSPALTLAQENVRSHHLEERVVCLQADLLGAARGKAFDLICANLPYIPSQKLRSLTVYGREPILALDGGVDGLELFRRLLDQIPACLAPGGLVLLEIEASQGESALALARQAFPKAKIELHTDLAGRDRLIAVQQAA